MAFLVASQGGDDSLQTPGGTTCVRRFGWMTEKLYLYFGKNPHV
jgi:hypothetical protein